MPEYHQLQTYLRLHEATIRPQLLSLGKLLQQIGCWSPEIGKAIKKAQLISDKLDDESLVDKNQLGWANFLAGGHNFMACPSILVWTPEVNPHLTEDWLEINLLFESSKLADIYAGQYHPGIEKGISSIAVEMSRTFTDTGVYLTDEVWDGEPFEGLVERDDLRKWDFDLAVIPRSLRLLYAEIPPTHDSYKKDGLTVLRQIESW